METTLQARLIPALSPGRVVRVTVPAEVAFNLDRFQKSVNDLAARLGCLPCLSGAICLFDLERNFVVNPEGKVNPDPTPWIVSGETAGV